MWVVRRSVHSEVYLMNRRYNAFLTVRAEIVSVASGLGRQIVWSLPV